ncbi:MAG: hypothetical protein IJR36_09605 [Lachnospiraceae bacterium]|nr:hypothetical protein [Lachnospiraceae bacterium]MBQ9594115.1 hypothetical protein [Lachnospiraceae bacterium]MBR0153480.1 hypothetical protein [Lachnospiraceae bacterium]
MRSKYRVVVIITFFVAMMVGTLFMSTGSGSGGSRGGRGAATLDQLKEGRVVKVNDEALLSLFTHYYTYCIADDMDGLEDCVSSIRLINRSNLRQRYQYIDKIDHLACYAAPAVESDFFVVYVQGDMYIRGIETPAPTLSVYLVARTFDDSMVVFVSAVPEEEAENLEKLNNSDSVRKLSEQVNQELAKARKKDAQLDEFVRRLQEAGSGSTETE